VLSWLLAAAAVSRKQEPGVSDRVFFRFSATQRHSFRFSPTVLGIWAALRALGTLRPG
jgi:hypothetical protein